MDDGTIAVIDDGGTAAARFRSERRARLVAPEDDMWAHLAEDATPSAVVIDDVVGGYCAVDDDHQLRSFYLTDRFEAVASVAFAHVVDALAVVAALPSTVDPPFLTLSLTAGGAARPVGLMYEHVSESTSSPVEMRLAGDDDLVAVVAFDHEQTGSPFDFLEPYLATRIRRGELAVLVDDRGRIAATGECRTDDRSAGHAHLGLIVRVHDRNGGLGRRVLGAMIELARLRDLRPLCSTEPNNLAAQHVIRHAGFRFRHSVMHVPIPG